MNLISYPAIRYTGHHQLTVRLEPVKPESKEATGSHGDQQVYNLSDWHLARLICPVDIRLGLPDWMHGHCQWLLGDDMAAEVCDYLEDYRRNPKGFWEPLSPMPSEVRERLAWDGS